MTKDRTFQQVGSTLSFPGKHVVGVLGSLQEGEQAVQALVDAGYHVEDMALIPNQHFPSALQEHVRKEGRFLHTMHQLQVTTDEGSLGELLEASAPPGSAIISLYVPQGEHLDEVSALLFNHGARLIKYVGNWSVEDLFPPLKEENVSAGASTELGDERGTMQQEQEKQEIQQMNGEPSQQTTTAPSTGKPDVEFPTIGLDSGSAWGPVMDY